jgi:CubicO group peptidase (beta-lactamase class C family)
MDGIARLVNWLGPWLELRARRGDLVGFAVSVLHGDRIVFSQAFGHADLEVSEGLTTNHLFGIGSQSKMFTAVAVLQLVEGGHMRLDDAVVSYLPWLERHDDRRFHEVTVRQLLSHSSGLVRDAASAGFWQLEAPFPDAHELQARILDAKLVMEPNSGLKYSNLGFSVLGQVVETVAATTYRDYIDEHIAAPARLTSTHADLDDQTTGRLVPGYGPPRDGRRAKKLRVTGCRAWTPVAGVVSNCDDMCRFAAAHFPDRAVLLSDAVRREMSRTQWIVPAGADRGHQVGLGVEILPVGAHRLVGHSGHMAGHVTATFWDPDARLAVAVMSNDRDAPVYSIVRGIYGAFDVLMSRSTTPSDPALTRFEGRFESDMATMEVVSAGDRLLMIDPATWEPFGQTEQLEVVDARHLRVATIGSVNSQGEELRYDFDDTGVATGVIFSGNRLAPVLRPTDEKVME